MIKPYYQGNGVTIYHGDCRDILPELEVADVIITDPVWPNNNGLFDGSDRPFDLLGEAARYFPEIASRLVLILGCGSDPRFLLGVPREYKFLRVCWLQYVVPNYVGRLMNTSDIAYVFGEWPRSKPGARVLPGQHLAIRPDKKYRGHPSPRKLEHMRWLVNWFSEGMIIDPFMGSGTTLRAAQECGWPAVGIEIKEEYCELAVKRCREPIMDLRLGRTK